jgi:PPE family
MHPWMVFTPEVNYQTITSGAGPGPTVAHAEGWTMHAAHLESLAAVSTVNAAGTYGTNWDGVGSIAAAVAHGGMNAETTELAAVAASKVQTVLAAAEAHPMTVARMVTAEHAVANRLEEAGDEQINPLVWGALTPRIADLNLEYFGFMWPNNAAAGLGYGAVLRAAAAAMMAPSLPAMSGASPAAAAVAGGTIAEAAVVSGLGAAMQAAEQGAMAVVSPAAAPVAALSAVTSSVSSVSTSPVTSSAPAAEPMAAVQHVSAVPNQSLAPAQAPVGMFAQPPSAVVMTPPVAPNPAVGESPVAQLLTPRPAPVVPPMRAPAPGVTSFVPPAEPFAPPPPTAGRATGLGPGMLNAAALRGPVTTMPLTTNAASTLATAAQPLAHVPPEPPRPPMPLTPPRPPLLNPGDSANTLNPPPPTQLLTPPPTPQPANPPAAPQNGPPAPSTDVSGPGSGTGVQMLGSGPSGAPQAPPIPLDPEPTPDPTPPPPVRGRPPEGLRPPVDGNLTPGPPSRAREQRKGAEHLWDDQGGEWRYHGEDSSHNPHWDYKPPGKYSEWEQIPIGGLPPEKGGDPSIISGLPPWLQNPAFPGAPGPPQNPLLAPYPGATMPAPPPAYSPPPGPGLMPHIDVPPLNPGDLETAGGETAIGGGALILLIIGALALA